MFKNRRLLMGCGAAVVAVFACGLLALLFGDPAPAPDTDAVASTVGSAETAATEAEPTEMQPTEAPAPTPGPAATLSELEEAIATTLNVSNRGDGVDKLTLFEQFEEGILGVSWRADENFGPRLTRLGIMSDMTAVLLAIDASTVEHTGVSMSATLPLTDQFGNTKEEEVVIAFYSPETIGRINWDGFLATNILDIADSAWVHPAIQDQ